MEKILGIIDASKFFYVCAFFWPGRIKGAG